MQVTGHSTEKLLLGALLPVVHTAIWNIVLVLISTCGSFLLPFAVHVESNLVQGMTDLSQELKRSVREREREGGIERQGKVEGGILFKL